MGINFCFLAWFLSFGACISICCIGFVYICVVVLDCGGGWKSWASADGWWQGCVTAATRRERELRRGTGGWTALHGRESSGVAIGMLMIGYGKVAPFSRWTLHHHPCISCSESMGIINVSLLKSVYIYIYMGIHLCYISWVLSWLFYY